MHFRRFLEYNKLSICVRIMVAEGELLAAWGLRGVIHTVHICVAICFGSGLLVVADTTGLQAGSQQCLAEHDHATNGG